MFVSILHNILCTPRTFIFQVHHKNKANPWKFPLSVMSNVQNVAKELQYLLLAAISLSAENNAKHEEDIQDKEMP